MYALKRRAEASKSPEAPQELPAVMDDLILEHKPATPAERTLVEAMAHHRCLSLRAIRLQADMRRGKIMFDIPKDLALLIRSQIAADRAFHQARQELVKLQKQREKSQIGFVSQNAAPAASQGG